MTPSNTVTRDHLQIANRIIEWMESNPRPYDVDTIAMFISQGPRHIHLVGPAGDKDICGRCGLDLRHPHHLRMGEL